MSTTTYCHNCGGDGYTYAEPVCPACNGSGVDSSLLKPRASRFSPMTPDEAEELLSELNELRR